MGNLFKIRQFGRLTTRVIEAENSLEWGLLYMEQLKERQL